MRISVVLPQTSQMMSIKWSSTVVAVLLCVLGTNGVYIQGIDSVYYKMGQRIDVKAVQTIELNMTRASEFLWLQNVISTGAHCMSNYPSVPLDRIQNFGQLLRGDRKFDTGYVLELGKNVTCRSICSVIPNYKITLSKKQSQLLVGQIINQEFLRLDIDNLPAISKSPEGNINVGYPLGIDENNPIINNFLKFKLRYRKHGEDEFSIVGFEIETDSIDANYVHFKDNICSLSLVLGPQNLKLEDDNSMYFMYSVEWVQVDANDNDRHDIFNVGEHIIREHFQQIFYLFGVGFIFSVAITVIVTTIRGREQSPNFDESINERGWRSLHGDVFRIPTNPQLFAGLIGTGIQIYCAIVTTLLFGAIGLISTTRPGDLVINVIFSYAFCGYIAGHFMARLYKTLGDEKSAKKSLAGSILVSMDQCVFMTGFFFSLIFIVNESNGPVPCTTMIAMLVCFIGLSTLCIYIGDYHGHNEKPFVHPVKTNEIPRPIVIQACKWCTDTFLFTLIPGTVLSALLSDVLPVFFTSIWTQHNYSAFGIYFVDFCIFATLCSQITILVIYGQLCREDYRWWWRSFYVSGSSAIYILAFSLYYYRTRLMILDTISILMFFGYTMLIIVAYWLLFGTIGFFAAYVFIRQIYATVKINSITDKNSIESIITEKPPKISSENQEQSSQKCSASPEQ